MEAEAAKGSRLPNVHIPAMFERRPFAVRALTVLLFIQAFAFIVIAIRTIDWSLPFVQLVWQHAAELSFLVMGVIDVIAAVGFVRLRPAAWLMAMVVQGFYLLLTLFTYFILRPESYTFFGLMIISVVIVFYLNYAEVPALFLRWRIPETGRQFPAQEPDYYEDFPDQDF